jgi:integrase
MKMSVKPVSRVSAKTGALKKGYRVDVTAQQPDGTVIRKQKRLMGVSKRDAEKYERELRSLLLNGEQIRKEKKEVPTLDEFKDDFLSGYVEDHCRPKERSSKEAHFRLHLSPFFGSKRLDEITARDIDAYKSAKRGTLAAKTINMHLSTSRLALKLAVKWDIMERLPVIEWLPLKTKERKHFKIETADKLIAATDPQWRAMISTALECGLRLGELLALRWEDVGGLCGLVR